MVWVAHWGVGDHSIKVSQKFVFSPPTHPEKGFGEDTSRSGQGLAALDNPAVRRLLKNPDYSISNGIPMLRGALENFLAQGRENQLDRQVRGCVFAIKDGVHFNYIH